MDLELVGCAHEQVWKGQTSLVYSFCPGARIHLVGNAEEWGCSMCPTRGLDAGGVQLANPKQGAASCCLMAGLCLRTPEQTGGKTPGLAVTQVVPEVFHLMGAQACRAVWLCVELMQVLCFIYWLSLNRGI